MTAASLAYSFTTGKPPREIHAAGGIVIVQEPATAEFDFMLEALWHRAGGSARPPTRIAAALLQYVHQASDDGIGVA